VNYEEEREKGGNVQMNIDKKEKLIRYSMQLAYLHTLLKAKLITENEYSLIKKKLQKDYKVPSDILADYESRSVR